jgi:hypothetical protein
MCGFPAGGESAEAAEVNPNSRRIGVLNERKHGIRNQQHALGAVLFPDDRVSDF